MRTAFTELVDSANGSRRGVTQFVRVTDTPTGRIVGERQPDFYSFGASLPHWPRGEG